MRKIKYQWFLLRMALKTGAVLTWLDYLVYRTPLKGLWKHLHGHRFHKSTIFWFKEGGGIHTRAVFLLSRLRSTYPNLQSLDMDFEYYDEAGRLVKRWTTKESAAKEMFLLDSQELPKEFQIPKPFSGSLLVKQTLHLSEKEVLNKGEIFSSTSTYLDYYSEGNFIATVHDYCAYLPDQGMNYGSLGMIPAYCEARSETFLIFHASKPGIGPKDIEVILLNKKGEKKTAFIPGLKPFAMRRWMLSGLFPDAADFLDGEDGQVVIEGIFRQLLRRIAYGVLDKNKQSFTLDHCYYSLFPKKPFMPSSERAKIAKGWFNPFFVMENEFVTTTASLFQDSRDPDKKKVDLLIYDDKGKKVASFSPFAHLAGNEVKNISFKEIFKSEKLPLPFAGHAELIYHKEPGISSYPNDLDVNIDLDSHDGRKLATVGVGSYQWNPSHMIENKSYKSVCRAVCNEHQTTYLSISNCSYDYEYRLEHAFTVSLFSEDGVVASRRMTIGPNATLYRSVEEFFPDARELLKKSRGVGLIALTDLSADCLANLFITEDRRSRALSIEHSLAY